MKPSKKYIQRKWQIGRATVKELRELRIEKGLHIQIAAGLTRKKALGTKKPQDVMEAIDMTSLNIQRLKQDIRDAIAEKDRESEKELRESLEKERRNLAGLFALQKKKKK